MNVPSDMAARARALEALEGHLQLVACAGAGKTEPVARRIVETLKLPGVSPENVAAFTFTEKAAAEQGAGREPLRGGERAREGLADLYVGTIHAFCLRLLQ
jgi:DNA helicase II / ATP-dependent DNA helicase PcrA